MTMRAKWQYFRRREWSSIRDSMLEHIPGFQTIGARPDPGLETLQPLSSIVLEDTATRNRDVEGLRATFIRESVFLFHKCSHVNFAANRLGEHGMLSWSLFNAYHSAYLGAKGIMTLLGVAFPNINSLQAAIDIYPESDRAQRRGSDIGSPAYTDFIAFRLRGQLEHQHLWEVFQRMLAITKSDCMDENLIREISSVSYAEFGRARNRFLYKSHYWPLDDICLEYSGSEFLDLPSSELDADDQGFLLRLSFLVYRLYEQLISDLGKRSDPIRAQVEGSMCVTRMNSDDIRCYSKFASGFGI